MGDVSEPTGRELDELVAVRLFGWRYCHSVNELHGYDCVLDRPERAAEMLPEYVWDSREGKRPLIKKSMPEYSTDIAAAWLVVAHLVAAGRVVIVKGDGLRAGDHNPAWTVLIDNSRRTDAATAPLAICRAALKAMRALQVGRG